MKKLKHLDIALQETLSCEDASDVLAWLTAHFVGIVVELARRQGHDTDKQIMLDGGTSRDITIHAKKVKP